MVVAEVVGITWVEFGLVMCWQVDLVCSEQGVRVSRYSV